MRIRMLQTMAGPGGVVKPGQEVEVSDEKGEQLVLCGYALEVAAETPAVPKTAAERRLVPESIGVPTGGADAAENERLENEAPNVSRRRQGGKR